MAAISPCGPEPKESLANGASMYVAGQARTIRRMSQFSAEFNDFLLGIEFLQMKPHLLEVIRARR